MLTLILIIISTVIGALDLIISALLMIAVEPHGSVFSGHTHWDIIIAATSFGIICGFFQFLEGAVFIYRQLTGKGDSANGPEVLVGSHIFFLVLSLVVIALELYNGSHNTFMGITCIDAIFCIVVIVVSKVVK